MENVERDSQTYAIIGCLIKGGTPDTWTRVSRSGLQLWRSSIELQAICSLEPKCIYSVLICGS